MFNQNQDNDGYNGIRKKYSSNQLTSFYSSLAVVQFVLHIVFGLLAGKADAEGGHGFFDWDIVGDDGFFDFIVWVLIFGAIGLSILIFKMLILEFFESVQEIRSELKNDK